jgi:hypothetical protein
LRRYRKVIVFSMWHGVLKMVQKTLTRNGVRSVWCEAGAYTLPLLSST